LIRSSKRRFVRAAVALGCLSVLLVPLAAAATDAGDLDASFGNGGTVTTQVGVASSGPDDLALQPDGKIIGFGQADFAIGWTGFAITRHDVNGAPDPEFGDDGGVLTSLGGLFDEALGGLVQPDGKIVAAGFSIRDVEPAIIDFGLARYLSNGDPDPSFGGGDGKVAFPIGQGAGRTGATAIALDADGKLVLTGGAYNAIGEPVVAVVRLDAAGAPDTSFDSDGIVLTKVGTSSSGTDVKIQPDGKILVAVDQLDSFDLTVLRYNQDGSPDAGFGNGGKASRTIGSNNSDWKTRTTALALTASGGILVGGDRRTAIYGGETLLAAFTPAGEWDTGALFHGIHVGPSTTEVGEFTGLVDVLLQSDGRIILAGWRGPNSRGPVTFALYRLKADGSYDESFSCNGVADAPLGTRDWGLTGAALDGNGHLVASGIVFDDTTSDFGLARYHLSGTPNCSTGGGGGGGGGGGVTAELGIAGNAQPVTAAVGQEVTFNLRVTNVNLGNAAGIKVDVDVPAGLALVSTSADRGPGCAGTPLVCDLDWLSSSTPSANITIRTRVTAPGELALRASVRFASADAKPENNSVTIIVNRTVARPPTAPAPAKPTPSTGTTKTGTAGANTLRGTARADTLRGLGGNDKLYGAAGNDRLFGGSGNDRLFGGLGRDLLEGGIGNDTISARDSARDTIRCGRGRDVVIADRIDIVARDCERVTRR
jgi:uncharacterized delta-60 repeat protein